VHYVRRSYKENLRQVILHVEVVIDEHEILFGIEHFEQCGRWVTAEVHRHLVDFIQHKDRFFVPAFFII